MGRYNDEMQIADIPQAAIGTFGVSIPIVFLSMLEKGKDAYLPVGSEFSAYLNGDITLDRKSLERVQPAPVERKGPATVTIFATATAMWDHRFVYCGTVALARLPRSTYLKIQLPPGKYSFRSEDEQVVEVLLREGQDVYLQMLQMATHNGIKAISFRWTMKMARRELCTCIGLRTETSQKSQMQTSRS